MKHNKYKITFIEEPEILSNEKMMNLLGGGLCIGFTNCGCNTDKKGTYSNCKKTKQKKDGEDKKEKFFFKKYHDTYCLIVTIKDN